MEIRADIDLIFSRQASYKSLSGYRYEVRSGCVSIFVFVDRDILGRYSYLQYALPFIAFPKEKS